MSRISGDFSTFMDPRSSVSVGFYLLRMGIWGLIRRRSTIRVSVGWYGSRDEVAELLKSAGGDGE
jgi:hypothetical protein